MRSCRPLQAALLSWSLWAPALAVLLDVGAARAQPQGDAPRLNYSRGLGAEGCPDEQGLRDVVASLLGGADPFAPPATAQSSGETVTDRMDVAIVREGNVYRASIALYSPAGHQIGAREHTGPSCSVVVEDVATTISVALRPLLSARTNPSPPAPTPPLQAAPPAAAPRQPAPLAPAPPDRPRVQIGAAALLVGGIAPALAVGFGGSVGIRWEHASVSLEGRGDLPASAGSIEGSTVRTSLLAGSLVPCFHQDWFLACGLVAAGRLSASAGPNLAPEERAAAYAGMGGRLGVEVPVSERFAGQLAGDVVVNLARPTMRFDGEKAWGAATVSELASLRLVAWF